VEGNEEPDRGTGRSQMKEWCAEEEREILDEKRNRLRLQKAVTKLVFLLQYPRAQLDVN
jgi:predicted nucleic acid-binding Zn ribbon protein